MQVFDYGLAALGVIIAFATALAAYLANTVLTHVLVESPTGHGAHNSYALINKSATGTGASLLRRGGDDAEEEDDDDSLDELDYATYHDKHAPRDVERQHDSGDATSTEMQTLSLLSAWRNLLSGGKLGAFRAVTITTVHSIALEGLLHIIVGGSASDPSMALAGRFYNDTPAAFMFGCALKLLLAKAIFRVALIPLDVVATRQIVGRPDASRWYTLLVHAFAPAPLRQMLGCIIPTLLRCIVPAAITLAASALHLNYLRSPMPESVFDILRALLEIVVLLATQFTVAPLLQYLLLRSHLGVIGAMASTDARSISRQSDSGASSSAGAGASASGGVGEFDAFVATDKSHCPGVLVALMQVLQADKRRFANPAARFWRHAKFALLMGGALVAGCVLAAMLGLPLYLHTVGALAPAVDAVDA